MKKHPQRFTPDRFPGVLEASGYRKTSEDFTWTIATPKKYEEYAKTMLGRLSSGGVFYFIHCATPEEVDHLLKAKLDDGEALSLPSPDPGPRTLATDALSVEEMAETFGMTTRYVQMLEAKGIFAKNTHGRYDLRKSVKGYAQHRRDITKTSDLNMRRMENLEKKNRELDRQHAIEMGKLVNGADAQRVREMENANNRQKWIYLPALTPQLEGRPAVEINARLVEYMRKALEDLDRSEPVPQAHDAEPDEAPPVEQPGKKKKQGVSRKARKGRKGGQVG